MIKYFVGDISKILNVSTSTIRFWEREGLIKSKRSKGRFRYFTEDDLETLKKIKSLKDKGYKSEAIKEILKIGKSDTSDEILKREKIGDKIKRLIQRNKISVKELAKKTGLSVSFLNLVEQGKTNLSVGNLKKIANALNVNTLYFFPEEGIPRELIRAGERKSIFMDIKGVRVELLAEGNTAMEPLLFYIEPAAGSEEFYTHKGEEFIYVLMGKLKICIERKTEYILCPGDSLYFESTRPHKWINPTDNMTVVIWVNNHL